MKKAFLLLSLFTATLAIGQSLGVMSYNIRYDNPQDGENRWDNRKEHLISQLNFYAPDVFGTQEGLLHQLGDLKNGLNAYGYVGVGRDDGKEKGEFTAIFYHQETVELLKDNTFWLSLTPDKPSKAWDAALPRICTYSLFKMKESGRQFYVFNTHFDHIGEQARLESSLLILSKIKQLNTGGLPVILMGDFNMDPNSTGYSSITKEMKDCHIEVGAKAYGPGGTFNGFDITKPTDRRIDYIFVSDGFKPLKSAIFSTVFNGLYPSDHFPVYTELDFEK
ncbi:endonuclease/exonuclease/phosphatase family protein [Flagellimonas flava]|uniref:Metal-dependent hydrolase, endonuclease/exonuclease/phosphatase family n=1 Tax=Flagellimonas flava TaxID=570519 RepID=A0A1M5I0H5_9FLAO|nr:endonuclease/exonuclease/phosphatase family protein [Allomuricauda flava]SHG21513.1 Metal-dependent hydrolase, endonuclease/exonuclease/phosphatase family [Allomuricauda flava]